MTERASATRTTEQVSTVAPVSARPSRAAAARLDPALTRLQRSYGNRYVQRVVATSRAAGVTSAGVTSAPGELSVGAANDTFEHEADRTADRVMRSISSQAVAPPHQCGAGCVQRHAGPSSGLAAEVGAAGGTLTGGLSASISSVRGGGARLPDGVRSSMESAFGTDFSAVRVHAGSDLAGRVASTAFTLGRDIYFAPDAYRPGTRSGQWLLAHELTHVVQQDGSRTGPLIRRHASKEHYLLGALTPTEMRSLAYAKGRVTGHAEATAVAKVKKKTKKKAIVKPKRREDLAITDPTFGDAVRAVTEQLVGLGNWRNATAEIPAPSMVTKGATHYDRSLGIQSGAAQFDHKWGGQLVTLRCANNEELVCTLGDLNALPDFFGSLDDVAAVDKAIVFRTLQVIRRETYIYLRVLLAELQGTDYSYNPQTEGFGGLEGNTINVANSMLPDVGNAVKDLLDTETMLEGRQGEQGLPTAIGASATLGRNACHFPPESWLRWLDHHRRARDLIRGATDLNDLAQKANDAIVLNAFGEHYLQDSFAGGHLINKGYVMAQAMTHMTAETKRQRGITDDMIERFREATAHSDAYDIPSAAFRRTRGDAAPSVLDNAQATTARDPQTALEAARTRKANEDLSGYFAGQAEVAASGIDPDVVDYDAFRMWLNDFWLQKITNTLHDKFCLKGLVVGAPADPLVFRVYGDSNMIRSQLGATKAAEASRMSQDAINTLVENKRAVLTAAQQGVGKPLPRPVSTENAILSRFPDRVVYKGRNYELRDWATGAPMDALIQEIVGSFKGFVTEGKMTALVRVASPFKTVSAGLTRSHTPF